MITKLLNIRNLVILGGSLAAGWFGYGVYKNYQINKLERDVILLEFNLEKAANANKSNQQTIAELSAANQQCALTREANSKHAEQELTRHKGRIADITNKYDELRKQIPKFGKCADAVIDDDVIRMLQANGSD